MGNVIAASPVGFSAPKPEKQEVLENPGTYEDLHKKCKDVFPNCFDGVKLLLNKGITSHFQVSHTINLSNVTPTGYKFGATYVGTKQLSPSEAFPVLLGDIDPSGNLNANIIHQFGERIRTKFGAQVQNSKFNQIQYSLDYRGDDYTASLTFANPNLFNHTGVAVLHYLQQITPSLALGTELVYQSGPQIAGGEISVLNAAARYQTDDWVLSGSLGQPGIHICYYQKASQQIQFGVELETSFRMAESVATLAYQVDIPKTDLLFKGMADSNWNVGAVLEKRLQPLPFTFALSGQINHSKNNFRIGIGMIIG